MFLSLLLFITLLAFSSNPLAKSVTGNRVLLLLDTLDQKADFSTFLSQLNDDGFHVNVVDAAEKGLDLTKFDERTYDHLVLFCPRTSSLSLKPDSMVDFVKKGGNILMAGDALTSDALRDLAYEFNIAFDERGNYAVDHFHFNKSSNGKEDHLVLVANNVVPNRAITDGASNILYRGAALKVGSNPLTVKMLLGSSSTYSTDPKGSGNMDENPYVAGTDIALVAGLQALNNARFTVAGSLDMFTDAFVNSKVDGEASGNEQFIHDLAAWTFQERGVLRIKSVSHHKDGETVQRDLYRIKDHLIYTLEVSEWKMNEWKPFKASDIQMEAIMLDPYVRTTLTPAPSSAGATTSSKYSAHFQLPDQYGMFTFKTSYKRPGWSYIEAKETLSVVPFRHDEYPRFLTTARPYYVGAFSTIIASALFSLVYLHSRQ